MKKVTLVFVLTFLILSLCCCTGITEQKNVAKTSPEATATLSAASESQNKNREDPGKRVPIKENFVDTLSGAVDYMRYISESEVLFEIWERDKKDHLYVYNAQTGKIGEGQDVSASSEGKYVMTKCMSNDSGKVNHRVYNAETGRIGCSFELDYAQFGSNYIFIDDINDMVYVFWYDMESNRKEMKLFKMMFT